MQTNQTVSQQKQFLSQEFGEWGQESKKHWVKKRTLQDR